MPGNRPGFGIQTLGGSVVARVVDVVGILVEDQLAVAVVEGADQLLEPASELHWLLAQHVAVIELASEQGVDFMTILLDGLAVAIRDMVEAEVDVALVGLILAAGAIAAA
ncbi:hypothetical protein D3C71_1382360 [compost metagenome]